MSLGLGYRKVGGFKSGLETVGDSQYDLYDRIINLEFKDKYGKTLFVIRSDYELKHNGDFVSFERCSVKPKIYFYYIRYADTGISIKLKVYNLNFFKSGILSTKSYGDLKPAKVNIYLGYRGQFANLTMPPYNKDSGEEAEKIKEFYNITSSAIEPDNIQSEKNTCQLMTCDIGAIYEESSAPDRVTVFDCFVGQIYNNVITHKSNTINYDAFRGSLKKYGDWPNQFLNLVFNLVTRRFFRTNIDVKIVPDGENISASVKNYNAKEHRFYTAKELEGAKKDIDGEVWEKLVNYTDGLMDAMDAKNLGVIVIPSALAIEETTAFNDKIANISSLAEVASLQNDPAAVLAILKSQVYPSMRPIKTFHGDFFMLSLSDNNEKLMKTYLVYSKHNEKRGRVMEASAMSRKPFNLPAVYSIKDSPLVYIKCPFISFLNPGSIVGFSSNHFIGNMVSYYLPTGTDDFFNVISVGIKFSTVGGDNEMTLTCNRVSDTLKKRIIDSMNKNGVESETENSETADEEMRLVEEAEKIYIRHKLVWRNVTAILGKDAASGAINRQAEKKDDNGKLLAAYVAVPSFKRFIEEAVIKYYDRIKVLTRNDAYSNAVADNRNRMSFSHNYRSDDNTSALMFLPITEKEYNNESSKEIMGKLYEYTKAYFEAGDEDEKIKNIGLIAEQLFIEQSDNKKNFFDSDVNVRDWGTCHALKKGKFIFVDDNTEESKIAEASKFVACARTQNGSKMYKRALPIVAAGDGKKQNVLAIPVSVKLSMTLKDNELED